MLMQVCSVFIFLFNSSRALQGPSKRRAIDAGDAADKPVPFDEGPGVVWNISKVKLYSPVPGTPPVQRLWPQNGDDKLVYSQAGLTVTSAAGYRMARTAIGISEGA